MDRDQFCAWALQIVKEARPEDTTVLDDGLRVVSTDANGKQQAISLQNVWDDFVKCSTDEERQHVLRRVRYLAGILNTGESFDEKRVLLMPRIRPRDHFEGMISRELAAMGVEDKPKRPPYRPFATHLAIGLAFDMPEHIEYLSDASDYPVSESELFDIALANLRRATKHGLTEMSEGIWIGDWGDEFAAERMLLPGMFDEVLGEPLVFVPGSERIYVAQAGYEESLSRLLALVDARLSRPRSLLSFGLVLRDGEWQVWDEFGYECPRMSERLTDLLAQPYAWQKEAAMKRGDTEFYSTVMGIRNDRDGSFVTMCTWTKGQEALLPRTHVIALLDPEIGGPILVTWGKLLRRAPGCVELVPDVYPPRYRTLSFPSEKQLRDWQEFPYEPKTQGASSSSPRSPDSPALHVPEPPETPKSPWAWLSPRNVALALGALALLCAVYLLIR